MKKIWNISLHTYIDWLTSPKQFLFIIEIVFLFQFAVDPFLKGAKQVNSKIHFAEPYIACMNTDFIALLIVLCYIVMIIELPKISSNHTFLIWRIGRKNWLIGQIIFIFMSALTYYLLIFVTISVYSLSYAEFTNSFSDFSTTLHNPENQDIIMGNRITAMVPSSLIMNVYPTSALLHSLFLPVIGALVSGLTLLVLSLKNRKTLGVILTFVLTLSGIGFFNTYSKIQWLFPISHIIFASRYWHIQTLLTLPWSYLYFGVLITILITLCLLFIRKFSFSFGQDGNEG